jgi:GTP-binding protein
MFIDEVRIDIESGHGGDGCVSFRREKFIPKGGPDGGDGGKGGSVYVRSSRKLQTLNHIRNLQRFRAKNGLPGMGKKKKGADGADVIVEVPSGTMVFDSETGELLHDFDVTIESKAFAVGGKGGLGNIHFKSSVRQAPRKSTKGVDGEQMRLLLELKLLADVALIGLPNGGKSSLLSIISRAKPKIADYPFTTLTPQLGLVKIDEAHAFTVADIPGLIEGAHEGAGLGVRFLRHIERTKYFIHVIDCSLGDADKLFSSYDLIRNELKDFNSDLMDKPEVIALNKIDLIDDTDKILKLKMSLARTGREIFLISAKGGEGIEELISTVGTYLIKSRKSLYGDILEVSW